MTDWIARICDGSWFQALGPAIQKMSGRRSLIVELMRRSPREVDRSLCMLPTDTTDRHRSARYDGASSCSTLSQQAQLELDALRNRKPVEGRAVQQNVFHVVVLLGANE